MRNMRRCIFLTGSPDAESLDWSTGLLSDFEGPVRRNLESFSSESAAPESTPSMFLSKWRAVPLDGHPANAAGSPETQLLVPSENQVEPSADRVGFLEYSLALIEGLDTSQVGASIDATADGSTLLSTASFTTNLDSTALDSFVSSHADSSINTTPPSALNFSGTVTDLRSIPTAQHLLRIQPQTPTVNIVAGVIAVSPARTVQLRKRNSEMDIIEVVVGDDTRAGFAISFWVVPEESQHKPKDDMRAALSRLRSGNVVLFQNVALSEFRDNVYGQSLNKRFARNSTSVAVLDRARDVDEAVQSAGVLFKNKWKRVRAWADAFIGVPQTRAPNALGGLGAGDELPPDTQ